MSTPLRKYHNAAGLSASSEQKLDQLEQRFQQLDAELTAMETAIEQRFPLLGLANDSTAPQSDATQYGRPKHNSRFRNKPR
ncbi:MAG: hypothetical protein JNK57_19365 [Planctomycetaceae bacterium]|nr:hypothetical protein [Planctomycetaceae bacterium]